MRSSSNKIPIILIGDVGGDSINAQVLALAEKELEVLGVVSTSSVPMIKGNGAELIAELVSQCAEPIVIVSTGPLTNVDRFLHSYPQLKRKISAIYFLGGGLVGGNETMAAESNVLLDPEAAKNVFESGLPITMIPLETLSGAALPAAVILAALSKQDIMTTRELYVEVETQGNYCRGATIADFYQRSGKAPNVKVVMDIDHKALIEWTG